MYENLAMVVLVLASTPPVLGLPARQPRRESPDEAKRMYRYQRQRPKAPHKECSEGGMAKYYTKGRVGGRQNMARTAVESLLGS